MRERLGLVYFEILIYPCQGLDCQSLAKSSQEKEQEISQILCIRGTCLQSRMGFN